MVIISLIFSLYISCCITDWVYSCTVSTVVFIKSCGWSDSFTTSKLSSHCATLATLQSLQNHQTLTCSKASVFLFLSEVLCKVLWSEVLLCLCVFCSFWTCSWCGTGRLTWQTTVSQPQNTWEWTQPLPWLYWRSECMWYCMGTLLGASVLYVNIPFLKSW